MAKKFTTLEFIEKAKLIHNEKYDYDLVCYQQTHEKVTIKCNYCNILFKQSPHSHLSGSGCPACNGKITTKEFVKKANIVHNNKYDYSLTNYTKTHNKVIIICKEHGSFTQKPFKHLNGQGCKICGYIKSSKSVCSHSEQLIYNWLLNNKISFKHQFEIITKQIARNSNLIIVDFFVEFNNKKYLIEFDGRQHFEYTPYFHKNGIVDFDNQKRRDKLLNIICSLNSEVVTLIRFDHTMSDEYMIKELGIIFNQGD